MALGDIVANLSELITYFPTEVSDNILGLIFVLKTLGIVAIIYIVYMITIGVLTYRKMRKLDYVEKKVSSIDKKLNRLLKKK